MYTSFFTLEKNIHCEKISPDNMLIIYNENNIADKINHYVLKVKRRIPYDGILLGEIVANQMKGDQLLDVGTGNGVIPLHVLYKREKMKMMAIEVNEKLYHQAKFNLKINDKLDCCNLFLGDIFQKSSSYFNDIDTLVCNPPLIPDEKYFTIYRKNNSESLFAHALIEKIVTENASVNEIYLHLFDFHGIFDSTGRWPSISEICKLYNIRFEIIDKGFKRLTEASKTKASLKLIFSHFPNSSIYVDEEKYCLTAFLLKRKNHNYQKLEIPYSIIKLNIN